MRAVAIIFAALLTGATANAGMKMLPERHVVVVCEDPAKWGLLPHDILAANVVTSQIFAGISIRIDWRHKVAKCPDDGIRLSASLTTPPGFHSGALAYALPFEGTQICVFYDRIRNGYSKSDTPIVLGHVLAHEITHILQNLSRHSASGVMKDRWDRDDIANMIFKPLRFEADDVRWIECGIAARESKKRNGSGQLFTGVMLAAR